MSTEIMDKPLVTVLMSVYNGKRFLQEAIESILDQTFTDFEFLIINDGSTDETCEIIQTYHDPRIRFVNSKSNLGLTTSLNWGLRLAKGQFIARQDSDDVSEPNRLARQVAYMEEHPNVGMLGTWYREIDDQGATIGYGQLPCNDTDIRWSLLFYCPFIHSSIIFPKFVALEYVGFYNEAFTYAQDYDYWARIARHFTMANLDEYLVRYRIHPDSMTNTDGDKTREQTQIPAAAVADLLGWGEDTQEASEKHFEQLFCYLYGSIDDFILQDTHKLAAEILQLHRAFCQANNLNRIEGKNHLAKLSLWISNRSIRAADRHLARKNKVGAWILFRQATSWYWPNLFTAKSFRLLIKFLSSEIKPDQITRES